VRSPEGLSADERAGVEHAFRYPRGRYNAARAAQLSGIPQRTVYDWADEGIVVPDFAAAHPKRWSYRDLVYLRLAGWLRAKGTSRAIVAAHVADLRARLADPGVDIATVRSNGSVVVIGDEPYDRHSGQQVFRALVSFLDVFDMLEPVDDLGRVRLWGPNLVHPSPHTYISPWVLGGEPCVEGSRVPTSTLLALRTERGLDTASIVRLYPSLDPAAVDDAIELESRLRGQDLPTAA
jgi:uncharacterized protein (DUF433 family)/DNA-binding transcriptional MerR regulator